MPSWLWRSILGISIALSALSGAQWYSCRYYVLPTVWPWYAKYKGTAQGKEIDINVMGCMDIDARTTATLMAVLTTLISLSRKAD